MEQVAYGVVMAHSSQTDQILRAIDIKPHRAELDRQAGTSRRLDCVVERGTGGPVNPVEHRRIGPATGYGVESAVFGRTNCDVGERRQQRANVRARKTRRVAAKDHYVPPTGSEGAIESRVDPFSEAARHLHRALRGK